MPYIVYSGADTFLEADNLAHAVEMARVHLESADDFARRMGWAPYWAEAVEIRKIKTADWGEFHRSPDIAAAYSTQAMSAAQIRMRAGMAPCPASRP